MTAQNRQSAWHGNLRDARVRDLHNLSHLVIQPGTSATPGWGASRGVVGFSVES